MHFSSLLRSSALIAGAVAPWLVAAAEGSDVIDLTTDNFASFTSSEGVSLVEFFAPWCGHCKALAPHYEEASTALKDKDIKLAKVDCVDQAELCQEQGVTGYPTLKVYRNGTPTDYQGTRQADGIISYMTKQSLPAVSDVTAEGHDQFTKADKVVVVAYVSSTSDVPAPVFSATAEKHRDDFLFGLSTDAAAIKAAGVTPPAIVVYKQFDEGRNDLPASEVTGATVESLSAFIKEHSMPLFDEISGENYGAYAQTGLPLAYLFVDPADPKKEEYIKELAPVAAEQKNKINFVWIDATKFADHAKTLALKPEWPAFVIQGGLEGQDKFPFDQTQEVSATNVAHFVKQFANGRLEPTLKSEPVPEEQTDKYYRLVGSEFEKVVFDDSKDVFVQFSAPWCGHCKRLAPTWEELGEKYADIKDRLVIAKMDGTENDLPSSVPFRIAGFPTLKFKPAGSRDFIDYEGDRSLESLVEFVEQRAKNSLVAPPKSEGADTNASAGRPAATPAATHQEL